MTATLLRFNLGSMRSDGPERTRLHRTMRALCTAADGAGVGELTVSEHHVSASRSLTSPMVAAATILPVTERALVSISALLLPLADPVRVAEDLACLDEAFPGRLRVVVALGYRREEYDLFDKDFEHRGRRFDEAIERLLATWAGAGLDPPPGSPRSAPPELLGVGGQTPAAARRAARFGLAFAPRSHLPELRALYEALCAERGQPARCWMPAARFHQVHLAIDPDRTWAAVGERYLEDAQEYARWQAGGVRSPVFTAAATTEGLRRSGAVRVVTPDECLALAAEHPDTALCLHPLAGGMSDDEAWANVELFLDRVVPALPSERNDP